MTSLIVPALSLLTLLAACTTPSQRRAAEKAALDQQAAQEISRICALPEPDRTNELKKIEEQHGTMLFCGN